MAIDRNTIATEACYASESLPNRLSAFLCRMADLGKRCPHCTCWQTPEKHPNGGWKCKRCMTTWRPQ